MRRFASSEGWISWFSGSAAPKAEYALKQSFETTGLLHQRLHTISRIMRRTVDVLAHPHQFQLPLRRRLEQRLEALRVIHLGIEPEPVVGAGDDDGHAVVKLTDVPIGVGRQDGEGLDEAAFRVPPSGPQAGEGEGLVVA